jgi:lysophospholipase L1-like esterase
MPGTPEEGRISAMPAQYAQHADGGRGANRGGPRPLSPGRRLVFTLAGLLIAPLFFVAIEVVLRLANYGGNLALFVSGRGENAAYYQCNQKVGRRFFPSLARLPNPPNDMFLKEKPENCCRIFVMGGSTVQGFPYAYNLIFSRMLQKRLADTYPQKRIEVVNTGMTAICSYALLDFIDEIISHEADAIVIYAGHNEFYGAQGAASLNSFGSSRLLVITMLKLQRLKVVLLLRNMIAKARALLFSPGAVPDHSDATLMERLAPRKAIPYRGRVYNRGVRQFERNMRAIVRKAKRAGLDIVLSEVVSNIRDQAPFLSAGSGSEPPADSVFSLGRRLEGLQRYGEARDAYYRAKDLDALRFRASEDINRVLHTLGEEFDVAVVPMKGFFEAASPHGIYGNNLMLEHLHPNVDGQFLIADALYREFRRNGFIGAAWGGAQLKPAQYYRDNWGMSALDTLCASLRIRALKSGWPFQAESAPYEGLHFSPATLAESLAVAVLSGDISMKKAHVMLGLRRENEGDYEGALREYDALVYAMPREAFPYVYAAKMLINLHRYELALRYLHESAEIEETAEVNDLTRILRKRMAGLPGS